MRPASLMYERVLGACAGSAEGRRPGYQNQGTDRSRDLGGDACDACIGFHAEAAVKQGASRDEVMETMGMAIYMGAGPSVMYAAQAVEAFDQFSNRPARSAA